MRRALAWFPSEGHSHVGACTRNIPAHSAYLGDVLTKELSYLLLARGGNKASGLLPFAMLRLEPTWPPQATLVTRVNYHKQELGREVTEGCLARHARKNKNDKDINRFTKENTKKNTHTHKQEKKGLDHLRGTDSGGETQIQREI